MSGAFERLTPRLKRSDQNQKRAGDGAKSDLTGPVPVADLLGSLFRMFRQHAASVLVLLLELGEFVGIIISLRCKSLAGMLTRETLIYWLLAPSSAADA